MTGTLNIVVGETTEESRLRRVVGIESESGIRLDANTFLDLDSVAEIPDRISDENAISTAIASLALHCSLPRVDGVGGSDISIISGKAVVLGGSDYARFVAKGMSLLGVDVTLVSSNPILGLPGITTMKPSVGDLEVGFCNAIGEFDLLFDTLDDENNVGALDNMKIGAKLGSNSGSGVVKELNKKHKCSRYVSTLNRAQRTIRELGILFGPGESKKYEKEVSSNLSLHRKLVSPREFGSSTLQKLLNEGITFKQSIKKDVFLRGWSINDFWEQASWPRDSEGTLNSRYGLPVIEDIFDEETDDEVEDEDEDLRYMPVSEHRESLVQEFEGVIGLQSHIIRPKQKSVVFLTASWCKLCRRLDPRFKRMARLVSEDDELGVTFAKAKTDGKIGKELGKFLKVESVPTFIMFDKGKIYGEPLSVSRLPNKKLDKALQFLSDGRKWDSSAFRENDD